MSAHKQTANRINIAGWGAVSPAGWNSEALHDAAVKGVPLPVTEATWLDAPDKKTEVRRVPDERPDSLIRSSRLRRVSRLSKFAVSAAVQALGTDRIEAVAAEKLHIGIVFAVMNGCVDFSTRFFSEIVDNPGLASPILFPETVLNAPSSHLSAIFSATGSNDTIVGDSAQFAANLAEAARSLLANTFDGCLLVAAEETNWACDMARKLFDRRAVTAEGAAAIYLERSPNPEIELTQVTGPLSFQRPDNRSHALANCRRALKPVGDVTRAFLVDGCIGSPGSDKDEAVIWKDWEGARYQPGRVLGDGMACASAWRTVLACELLARDNAKREAILSNLGGNQQAVCVKLRRTT